MASLEAQESAHFGAPRRCGAVTPSTRLVSNFAMKWVVSSLILRPFGPDGVSTRTTTAANHGCEPWRCVRALQAIVRCALYAVRAQRAVALGIVAGCAGAAAAAAARAWPSSGLREQRERGARGASRQLRTACPVLSDRVRAVVLGPSLEAVHALRVDATQEPLDAARKTHENAADAASLEEFPRRATGRPCALRLRRRVAASDACRPRRS